MLFDERSLNHPEADVVPSLERQIADLRAQLSYYRASVYKQEAQQSIEQALQRMRSFWLERQESAISEILEDDRSLQSNDPGGRPRLTGYPGECALSTRISRLLGALEAHLRDRHTHLPKKPQKGSSRASFEGARAKRRGETTV